MYALLLYKINNRTYFCSYVCLFILDILCTTLRFYWSVGLLSVYFTHFRSHFSENIILWISRGGRGASQWLSGVIELSAPLQKWPNLLSHWAGLEESLIRLPYVSHSAVMRYSEFLGRPAILGPLYQTQIRLRNSPLRRVNVQQLRKAFRGRPIN